MQAAAMAERDAALVTARAAAAERQERLAAARKVLADKEWRLHLAEQHHAAKMAELRTQLHAAKGELQQKDRHLRDAQAQVSGQF